MSGIRTGTRLEQLQQLHARIGREIEAERLRVALDRPALPRPRPPRERRPIEYNAVDARLEAMGVTSLEVKRWAHDAGLIAEIPRGRVASHLVQLFAEARARLNECVGAES